MITTTQTTTARTAIQDILAGNLPKDSTRESLGEFWSIYEALSDAHVQGGTPAARTAWNALCAAHPELAKLVAGAPRDDPRFIKSWQADELLSAQLPETRWIIPDLLPEGLSILAARPKIGKSWLALSICCAVGTGGRVLGRNVPRGRALYLALEDSPARLQSRMRKQCWPAGVDVEFELDWPQFVTGDGVKRLEERIANGGYTFVAIDVISRLTRYNTPTQKERIPAVLDALQHLALDHRLALLGVEHHRKPSAMDADVIDDVMGETVKTANADAVLGIYRKRGELEAHLKTSGRDIDELDLLIKFDKPTGTWQLVGNANEQLSQLERAILRLLRDDGAQGTNELAETLEEDPAKISKTMTDLSSKDLVFQSTDETDRRKKPWQLTARGIEIL